MKTLTTYISPGTTFELKSGTTPPPVMTKLSDIVNTGAWKNHGRYNIGDNGVIPAITSAWNGAAFDYATKTMHVVCSGGHGDSWNNQCYALDVVGGTWRMTKDQTPFPPDKLVSGYAPVNRYAQTVPCAGNGFDQTGTYPVTPWVNGAVVYFNGDPCSRHVYGATVWLPTQQRVMMQAGACWPGGSSDNYCGWFDPVAGTWTRKTNCPRSDPGQNLCYDAARDRVVYNAVGTQFVYSYNPATDTHTRIGPINTDPLASGVGGPYLRMCVVGDYVYATVKGGWLANKPTLPPQYANAIVRMHLGQATLQPWEVMQVTGDTAGGMYGNCPGMEYDAERNALVFWSQDDPANASILGLASFAISKQALVWTAPDATELGGSVRGVWGRFRRYAPNSYVLMLNPSYPARTVTLT